MKKWNVDFVVVYQDTGTLLDSEWLDAGYTNKGEFDWAECDDELRGIKPWLGQPPKWWLLQIPET